MLRFFSDITKIHHALRKVVKDLHVFGIVPDPYFRYNDEEWTSLLDVFSVGKSSRSFTGIFSEVSYGRRISKCLLCLSPLSCSTGIVQLFIEEAPVDGAQEYADFYSGSVGAVNLCTELCVSSFLHNLQSVLKKGTDPKRNLIYSVHSLHNK